jgi:hypothetical protein
MGQQQLLLIVLSVIVVGIAGYGGIRLLQTYNQSNDRDIIITHIYQLAAAAEQYYQKTKNAGGGGYSYTGLQIPKNMLVSLQDSIGFTAYSKYVVFSGYGKVIGNDSKNVVRVRGVWRNNKLRLTTVN